MGFWVYLDDPPSSGGGGSNNGGCLSVLACLLAGALVAFVLGYVKENLVSVVSVILLAGGLASAGGIIYILKETGFEKPIVIAGIVGFAAGVYFTNNILGVIGIVSTTVMGHVLIGLILAVAAMFLAIQLW